MAENDKEKPEMMDKASPKPGFLFLLCCKHLRLMSPNRTPLPLTAASQSTDILTLFYELIPSVTSFLRESKSPYCKLFENRLWRHIFQLCSLLVWPGAYFCKLGIIPPSATVRIEYLCPSQELFDCKGQTLCSQGAFVAGIIRTASWLCFLCLSLSVWATWFFFSAPAFLLET